MTPMQPEPCDTADRDSCPVPPLGCWDLRGQLEGPEIAGMTVVEIAVEGELL